MGYDVKVNDPFKGVALVQAYSNPAAGRHSLQIEINKRLYMDEATLQPHAGFAALQLNLMRLIDALIERCGAAGRALNAACQAAWRRARCCINWRTP